MRWGPVAAVVVITLALVAVLGYGFGTNPREVPSVLEGQVAPECALRSLEGESITLEQLRGKPVLINFWSTWCVPCKTEHGLLQQAASRWGNQVEFIGVVYQDEEDKARTYLKQRGSTYRQFVDPDSKCAINYGVAGVPETFFIDPQGMVHAKQTGPVSPDVLTSQFSTLLAKVAP